MKNLSSFQAILSENLDKTKSKSYKMFIFRNFYPPQKIPKTNSCIQKCIYFTTDFYVLWNLFTFPSLLKHFSPNPKNDVK